MPEPVAVRAVDPDEWEQWRELRLGALLDTPSAFASSWDREQGQSEEQWRGWLSRPDGARFIAYDPGGSPMGIAAVYLKVVDHDPAPSDAAGNDVIPELVSMWVRPQARTLGAGRLLVDAVSAWVASRGHATVHLMVAAENAGAEAFYDRIGFTRTGYQQPFPHDPSRTEVEMSRPTAMPDRTSGATHGCTLAVVWDPALTAYDFGPSHPLAPIRVELTMRLADDLGLLRRPGVHVIPPEDADDALLGLVHDADYIEAVRHVSAHPDEVDLSHGLGTTDDPVFPGIHEASARVVGASIAAARAVWEGTSEHAVNIAGGLHHAMPGAASGFCVYNDPAVAIRWLLEQGAERVAYVDVDVHHGDGVQGVFWDDPRVLTISLHESPRTLFPGTGYPEEIGGPGAEGYAVNVALPGGTSDAGWLRAFHAIVPPLLAEFAPDVLVSQHGCDSHADDPLANLALSVDGQRAAYLAIHELAHAHAGGRWLAVGGGGYAVVDVVPRAWSHLIAIGSGVPLDAATPVPDDWRAHVLTSLGRRGPSRMTDGADAAYQPFEGGYNPSDAVDRAITATRTAVFPQHGLDLHY